MGKRNTWSYVKRKPNANYIMLVNIKKEVFKNLDKI